MTEGLAVEGVEKGMSGTVCRGSAAVRLTTLAVLERLTAERALVDLALLRPRERYTEVLELVDGSAGAQHTANTRIAPQ